SRPRTAWPSWRKTSIGSARAESGNRRPRIDCRPWGQTGDGSAEASVSAWLTTRRKRDAWLFLLPMLVVLVLVAAWPLVRTIWLGFTDANLLKLDQSK